MPLPLLIGGIAAVGGVTGVGTGIHGGVKLNSFERFSNIIEKIQGRPDFKAYSKDGVHLPEYEVEE